MRKMMHLRPFAPTNESRKYEYGCAMLRMDLPEWEGLLSEVDPMDLYEPGTGRYGIEDDPHLTLLYGLHDGVTPGQVADALEGFLGEPTEVVADGIGVFENEEYDVVKVNVAPTADLTGMNESLRSLPHTNHYPEYRPHLTIAYVRKGMGAKYRRDFRRSWVVPCRVTYSMVDGGKVDIK